jgi:arabinose-5-phosphate isomerase
MSRGKLGSLIFVDEQNRPIAVLSDGDLRRALECHDFSLEHSALKYATKNPKLCDDPQMLAVNALSFVEENKIQLLLITNSDKNLLGVLHIHDLISAGIK